MRAPAFRHTSALPGFGLAFGLTMAMLGIVVILPIAALLWQGGRIGIVEIWQQLNSERVWKALMLSFRIAFLAAVFNLVFGMMLAWVLARYQFPAAA